MWASFFTVAFARIPVNTPLGIFLLRLGAYSPSLVAILLTARAAGSAGVSNLVSGVFKWRVPARYYVLAIAFIPAIKLTAALLHRLMSGAWPRMGTESLLLIPLAIAFSTPFQAGEEIGWRGYALPRLAHRFGMRAASVILGLIWALWHVPQFFIRDAPEFGQSFLPSVRIAGDGVRRCLCVALCAHEWQDLSCQVAEFYAPNVSARLS